MTTTFLDLLRSQRRFVLSGHEHPDGDCLGAQAAFYHLLRALGSEVRICNPDPVAENLRFLEKGTPYENFRVSGVLPDADVVVLLDCAHLSRLGDLGRVVRERSPQIAVIDHHVGSEDGDGEFHYVDTHAPATGVLVYDLYKECGVEIPAVAAEGIFVAIVADTGWFRYSNTIPRAMTIAGEMIERGVQPDALYDRLFRDNDPRYVALLSESLGTHSYRYDGRLVLATLGAELMARVSRSGFDTDCVLEPMRSVRGIEVAALFKELREGIVKLSLRAMGEIDVQAIAAIFGGGGHKKAAGATLRMPLTRAVDAVSEAVGHALEGN